MLNTVIIDDCVECSSKSGIIPTPYESPVIVIHISKTLTNSSCCIIEDDSQLFTTNMLRREATTIKLTPEDIQEYDQNNDTLQMNYLQNDLQEQEPDTSINPKSRNERIGVQSDRSERR